MYWLQFISGIMVGIILTLYTIGRLASGAQIKEMQRLKKLDKDYEDFTERWTKISQEMGHGK